MPRGRANPDVVPAPRNGKRWSDFDHGYILKHRKGGEEDLRLHRSIGRALGHSDMACRLAIFKLRSTSGKSIEQLCKDLIPCAEDVPDWFPVMRPEASQSAEGKKKKRQRKVQGSSVRPAKVEKKLHKTLPSQRRQKKQATRQAKKTKAELAEAKKENELEKKMKAAQSLLSLSERSSKPSRIVDRNSKPFVPVGRKPIRNHMIRDRVEDSVLNEYDPKTAQQADYLVSYCHATLKEDLEDTPEHREMARFRSF